MSPKITMITACLNQASFIGEAVASVVQQGYPNLEYIVCDGGSTDGTVEVLRDLNENISSWTSEADKGHYDAVNKGFRRSTGEIMGFLNSDDKLFPGALHVVGEVFDAHPDVEWITSLLPAAWDVSGHCIDVTPMPGYSKEAFLDGRHGGSGAAPWFIQQESTFWRRSLWDKVGGAIDAGISHAGDFDLWRRFYDHAELVGVKAMIGGFRIREGQRVSQDTVYADQCSAVLADAREMNGWRRNTIRNLLNGRGVEAVSGAGKVIRRLWGYQGRRIVRINPGCADGHWEIDGHHFL